MIQGSQTRNAIAGLIQKPPEGVADLVDEMDRDYQVKLSDLTLCSGVKQVKVTFTTDNGDSRAEAVKEYGEKLYYDTLSSMLAFLKYGRVAYERAWKYEPKTNLNTFDLNELPFRQTKMLLRNGEFAGIELKGKDEEKNPVTVNLDKPYAFWLAYNAKPTAPHGASNYVGAPCETYFERKNTRRMLRTFLDKYALGNRILYGPEKIPDPTHPDPNTAPMVPFADVVRPVLQVLEAGGWLILSNERQSVTGSNGMVDVGYKIEVKTDEGLPQNSEPILRVLEEQDSWQLLAFGIPPKTVTEGSEVGSFAMVAQQRVVLLALFEEIFLQIQKQFQAGVLDVLCEMNGCGPVTMDYTPLTERPDDLASEVVKAWLTDPKLSELVASGTVDILGLLEATAIPVTPEGKERLTKLITRLANPPAQPTNPDGTIKTPEQLKAEYAVKTGEPVASGEGGKPPLALSSPFLGSLWPGGVTVLADCGANGPGGNGFQPGNTCAKGDGGRQGRSKSQPKNRTIDVVDQRELKAATSHIFGKPLAPDDVADLVGAQSNSTVEIQTSEHPETGEPAISVTVTGTASDGRQAYEAGRLIFKDDFDGELQPVIVNSNFKVDKKYQGQGIGSKVFSDQVNAARDAGVKEIRAKAERGSEWNGYYTWARLGYDAELTSEQAESAFGSGAISSAESARISDLMQTPEGREWWKEHGVTFDGVFDLDRSSVSSRVLKKYMDYSAPSAPDFSTLSAPVGTAGEIELTNEQEAALDAAWDAVRSEREKCECSNGKECDCEKPDDAAA